MMPHGTAHMQLDFCTRASRGTDQRGSPPIQGGTDVVIVGDNADEDVQQLSNPVSWFDALSHRYNDEERAPVFRPR